MTKPAFSAAYLGTVASPVRGIGGGVIALLAIFLLAIMVLMRISTNRKSRLARCRARQKLRKGDEINERAFTQPLPSLDKFSTEIAKMRDRAAE